MKRLFLALLVLFISPIKAITATDSAGSLEESNEEQKKEERK